MATDMTDYTKLDAYPKRARAAGGQFVSGSARPFESFIAKSDAADGCWVWTGARTGEYGSAHYSGRAVRAHRVAWMLANGPIPAGMVVCHKCDNPPCVRLDHLFLGTVADNNRDRANKGRGKGFAAGDEHPAKRRAGEHHWCAKITDEQVRQIRRRVADGETQTRVAADLKIHSATVSRIVRQEWRKEVI